MTIAEVLLPEFDHEMGTTRKLLERVPDDKWERRPHPKSMPLGALATHVAQIAMWGAITLNQSEIDTGTTPPIEPVKSRTALLDLLDRNVAETRKALVGRGDAEFMAPWSLKNKGQTIFTMPKAAVWRGFVISHHIHHRAQLSEPAGSPQPGARPWRPEAPLPSVRGCVPDPPPMRAPRTSPDDGSRRSPPS